MHHDFVFMHRAFLLVIEHVDVQESSVNILNNQVILNNTSKFAPIVIILAILTTILVFS